MASAPTCAMRPFRPRDSGAQDRELCQLSFAVSPLGNKAL